MKLKELIEILQSLPKDLNLPVGFRNPHCYRGWYNILSFSRARNLTVGVLLNTAKKAVDETFTGWRGGEYKMTLESDVVFAEEGDSCNLPGLIGYCPKGVTFVKERTILESELYFFKLLNEQPSVLVSDSSYVKLLRENVDALKNEIAKKKA